MCAQEGDGADSHFKNMVAQHMEKFWIERREEIFNAPGLIKKDSVIHVFTFISIN